jgi:YHS domain-containing protein
MNTLDDFAAKIQAELRAADGPSLAPEQEAEYMSRVNSRREVFQRESQRVLQEIVRPRMQTLAGFFGNASQARKCENGRCTWWFGYTERFPASVKVELTVDHDEGLENVILSYALSILPAYTKYEGFDRMSMPLDRIDDSLLEGWLEQRLLKFVRTYVALEKTDRDQATSFATDPVCGMRIECTTAAATSQHLGHPFFFCSQQCCDEFEAEPNRYAKLALA